MIDLHRVLSRLAPASAPLLGLLLAGCAGWFGGTSSPNANWAPMPLQAAHLDEGFVPATAQVVRQGPARFVVKLKDGETEALSRLYFRDKAAARTSFRDWASDKPLFQSMDLVSCTYGGELVLAAKVDSDPEAVLTQLRNHPLVAYADPDFVAQAEAQG